MRPLRPETDPDLASPPPATGWLARARTRLRLPPGDLLRDVVYRRLWLSVLISSFGGQLTMLALPLTAALLLHASPTQMGVLTAMEIAPFILFSLPAGVWLDRVRKLPVYVVGELLLALAVASVPVAAWAGWLGMAWLWGVGFVIGFVYTVAGSAAQVVLTQVVPRERLVEAHAKNALASSGAEVAGPGAAGALIKLMGAPRTLIVDALLLIASAAILRGIRVDEQPQPPQGRFADELRAGLRFVLHHRLLLALAGVVGSWQACHQAANVVNILYATRELRLGESAVGLSYVGLGVGTVTASLLGDRVSRRLGPGPALTLGFALCALGWSLLALVPPGPWGIVAFVANLVLWGLGAVFIFINFISLRQSVTSQPMLGRMTSTMRWLILLPAGPGALLGGWLGEHVGLRAAIGASAVLATLMSLVAWRLPVIRQMRVLPVLVEGGASALAGDPVLTAERDNDWVRT